ncbi:MAG: ankyrin repeat domain-containing protein, partial [Pirellulales bacterium]|nr:ankyrin repeat domain-containing protein [Pirellulales bacterium]
MSSADQYDELAEACATGDLGTVKRLLASGLSPDGPDRVRDYERPLCHALIGKHLAVADHLMEVGAKIGYASTFLSDFAEDNDLAHWVDLIIDHATEECSKNYQEAFISAIHRADQAFAEKLLAACPSPSEFTILCTPLCDAIRTSDRELALWIHQLGFIDDSRRSNSAGPATLSVVYDMPELLGRLLDDGESAHEKVRAHQSLFVGHPSIYKRLRYVRDFPKNDEYEIFHEGSLLHIAAIAGSVGCAKRLLEAGADPQSVDSEGRTPAMLAALGGKNTLGVLELLPQPDVSGGPALIDLFTR